MEPVTKFVHTALFKSECGWNELHIKITFNGRYTIKFPSTFQSLPETIPEI